MSPKKKFKITPVNNFRELLQKYKNFNDSIAFKYKQKGKIISVTYKQYIEDIKALGTAIINLGVERIAIIGNNRYEWCTSYMATVTAGKEIVPLDKALTDKEIVKLIKISGAQAVIYDEKYQKAVSECELEYKICMDELIQDGVTRYKHLLKQGYDLLKQQYDAYDHVQIDNNKIAVMLFTPETTNKKKVIKLTQLSICKKINNLEKKCELYPTDILLSVLPIHKATEYLVTILYGTYCGITIVFCDGPKHTIKNIKDYKVTVFNTEPSIIEDVYEEIVKEIENSDKKDLIEKKKKTANRLLKFNIDIRKKLFNPILKQFDANLRLVLYEEASTNAKIIQKYNELGIETLQILEEWEEIEMEQKENQYNKID